MTRRQFEINSRGLPRMTAATKPVLDTGCGTGIMGEILPALGDTLTFRVYARCVV